MEMIHIINLEFWKLGKRRTHQVPSHNSYSGEFLYRIRNFDCVSAPAEVSHGRICLSPNCPHKLEMTRRFWALLKATSSCWTRTRASTSWPPDGLMGSTTGPSNEETFRPTACTCCPPSPGLSQTLWLVDDSQSKLFAENAAWAIQRSLWAVNRKDAHWQCRDE